MDVNYYDTIKIHYKTIGGIMTPTNTDSNQNHENLSRREREKLAHRQEILDAATRVFANKGFFYATLDEIAQEAEFSKGALYLYFNNKEDLLYTIIKEKTSQIDELVNEILDKGKPFKEELRLFLKKLATFAFSDKEFFQIFIAQHAAFFRSLSPEKAHEFCTAHKVHDELVIKRIASAIKQGELRNLESKAVYGIIHGASENMMFSRWECLTVEDLHNKIDIFIDILFNGIALTKEVGSEQ